METFVGNFPHSVCAVARRRDPQPESGARSLKMEHLGAGGRVRRRPFLENHKMSGQAKHRNGTSKQSLGLKKRGDGPELELHCSRLLSFGPKTENQFWNWRCKFRYHSSIQQAVEEDEPAVYMASGTCSRNQRRCRRTTRSGRVQDRGRLAIHGGAEKLTASWNVRRC